MGLLGEIGRSWSGPNWGGERGLDTAEVPMYREARRQLVGISSHLPLWDLGINLRSSSLATSVLPFQAISLALRIIIRLSLISDERLTDARKWTERLAQVIKMVLLTENLEKDNEWPVLDCLKHQHQCSHNTCHVSDTDTYWTDWVSCICCPLTSWALTNY